MFFSDKVTLLAVTTTLDSFGDAVHTKTSVEVWADKKSVARAEFYASQTAGIKIDTVFTIHAEDFANQTLLQHNGTEYTIVRAYQKGAGTVELNCAVREVK